MNDPRYWNKGDPEHAQALANAQRAFADAYREPESETDTSPETVHVRSYTRMQDGKEVEVSAYDRTQQIAFRGVPPRIPRNTAIDDVSSNKFHDYVQDVALGGLLQYGARAGKEVRVITVRGGVKSYPDIIAVLPNGRLIVIEVKTGDEPRWTKNQPDVYSLMKQGYEVYSDDPRIEALGFQRGEALPPFEVYVAYMSDANGSVVVTPLGDSPFAPGKRLDNGYKGKRLQ